jgi:hypothetical protein
METGIFVAVVCRLGSDQQTEAGALAAALGITLFEARARVLPPAPRVVATFQDREEAQARVAALSLAGFEPLLLDGTNVHDPGNLVMVRSFELLSDRVVLRPRIGPNHEVPYHEVGLLLTGMRAFHELHEETTTSRKFSLGKAVASGGLMLTSKKKVETTHRQDHYSFFLRLFAEERPTFALTEGELQYQGLGTALQPTRLANFGYLVEELKRRAPHAPFDNRLNTAAGQLKLLGPTLSPDRFFDLALAILARHHGIGKNQKKVGI